MRIIGNDPNTPRQTQVVASGTLSTGDTVIVNSDGTVSAIGSGDQEVGTEVTFESAATIAISSAYDANANKIVVVYRDNGNSDSGTAVVGTVSGSSISFGTPVAFTGAIENYTAVTFDSSNNKIVINYSNTLNSFYGTAIVGTVSGTSISFGSATVYESSYVAELSATFDSSNNKVVFTYRDTGGNGYGYGIVGTVSGTSISFGTKAAFESANTYDTRATFDTSNNKVVIAYRDGGNSFYGTAVVGTVSGTSISYGSPVVFESANARENSITFDSSNNKVVITYEDAANSGYGTAIVGTVSGTSISFGTAVVFEAAATNDTAAAFDASSGKVVIAYRDNGNSGYGNVIAGTISGTSISFGSPLVFNNTGTTPNISIAAQGSTGKTVISYRDYNASEHGKSVVYQAAPTNLTAENYIGTAKSGAADGDGVVVNTQGTVADIPATYYDIANASYDSATLDVSSQEASPRGMAFNSDGTKVYVVGTFSDNLSQYNCSTAYDISTASYSGTNFSFASQDTQPHDIVFNNDGTKLYMMGLTNTAIFRYSLSSAYDISTLSYDSVSFSVGSQATSPRGLTFGSNGNKLYVSDQGNDRIYEYDLSTAYDATSATYNSVSFDPTSEETNPSNVAFNSIGTKMFIAGNTTVYQYSLSSAFDISTASYDSVTFDLSSQVIDSYDIHFNPDGSKMYIVDIDNTALFQYSSVSSLTPAQSYYVQTDGTLGTTAGDPSVFAGTAVSSTKLIVKG